ncbi:hypothetical protein TI05_18775, partial [Achromatium sp. WMS3]
MQLHVTDASKIVGCWKALAKFGLADSTEQGVPMQRGYVILPVVIPEGMDPAQALDDNKVYAVVWQVLQALRAHDDRFDAVINKLDLLHERPDTMEIVVMLDAIGAGAAVSKPKSGKSAKKGRSKPELDAGKIGELQFDVGEIERAIYAKIVKKCGNRRHWEEWAEDVANIAKRHIDTIHKLLVDPQQGAAQAAFAEFANGLRKNLNAGIRDGEIVEMLAQHLITQPVFEALFANYKFAAENPMA